MRGFAAAIVVAGLAFLTWASQAEEKIAGSGYISAPPLSGIGAHDPRIRVDPDAVPWRAVGKLQAVSMNLRTLCTATLVGQSTVVTAAHCVFNRRTQHNFPPGSLHFLIGYNGFRYAGHATGVMVKIGDGYDPGRPRETIGSDWALVSLDRELGSADRVLPIVSELPKDGANIMLGGYQQDHPLLLMADTQCRIDGRFIDASRRLLLRHDCAGTHGVSGAPLLIDRGGRWQVAAIEVAAEMGVATGVAVVLNEAVKKLLNNDTTSASPTGSVQATPRR
jgi:protease YdgD